MNLPPGFGPPRSEVPPATIVAWAGVLTQPSSPGAQTSLEAMGWMVCDGRALNIAAYPALYSVLGRQYGGTEETFHIPNLEGQFLRGVTLDRSRDPGPRTPANPTRTTSDPVGSTESSALQNHVHGYTSAMPATQAAGGVGTTWLASPASNQLTTAPQTNVVAATASAVSVSSETRPTNTFVYYLIKFV